MESPTVVVPVYNAFREALVCIRSVLEHTRDSYQLLLLDDCSPEGWLADFLPDEVLFDRHVRVTRNERNLGFVKTCNLGMRRSQPSDVVLLNSDTEVTSGWLEKLRQAAYSSAHIATVTPLTNNGEICSVPEFLKDNDLPPGYDPDEFARLVERVAAREYPVVPTCVGFCVYIKREVLDRIGLFDEESFGKGYGEENDFSCRARAAGYVDIVDDATFVYHKGRMSFQDHGADLMAEHLGIVAKRHPDYSYRVHQFIARNPMREIHRRIQDGMLQRWMERAEYAILHVLHNEPLTPRERDLRVPGGVEFHVADLIRTVPNAAHWSLFSSNGAYCLTAHVPGMEERRYSFPATDFDLSSLIDPALFDLVHVHHINHFPYDSLAGALLQHGRYFVSLHDFRLCCPEPHLLTRGNRFCDGQGCAASCRHEQDSIDHLRSTSSQVLQNAHAVIHFSQSTKNHFAAIMGEDYNWKLIEHGVDLSTTRNSSIGCGGSLSRPSADRPLKVAFLGGLGPHKGFHLVQRIVKHRTLPSGIPVEWHVIGMTSGELRDRPHIIKHGRYARKELPAIMREISPDLVAILSICPETYCFTLDEALMCGVPIISTPLGAPADRVQRDQCGWVLEALELETIFEKLQWVVDSWNTSYREVRRRIPTISLRDVRTVGKAYDQLYHDACRGRKSVNITRRMHLLEKLASRAAYEIPWRRLLIGRALNECESLLYKLGIRSLAQKVVRQLLPHRMQCAIQNLRRLPVTSEERHGRFHDDARAA